MTSSPAKPTTPRTEISSEDEQRDPSSSQALSVEIRKSHSSTTTSMYSTHDLPSPLSTLAKVQYPLALSKAETVLLSSAGDVLVCRCLNGPYPKALEQAPTWDDYSWQKDLVVACCDAECDDISLQMQEASICSPWSKSAPSVHNTREASKSTGAAAAAATSSEPYPRPGLMGGAPTEVVSPLHGGERLQRDSYYTTNGQHRKPKHHKFESSPIDDMAPDFDAGSIVPVRSFDYSHFGENGNDMVPESPPRTAGRSPTRTSPVRRRVNSHTTRPAQHRTGANNAVPFVDQMMHGIPTFFPAFSQVRITQVSAHPLGCHVLLISAAGLLYSYGLNDFGQLGIGVQSRYTMTPTIVTPLVENGGKAIACAAGLNHSLVVVQTEEERIVKCRSFEQYTSSPSRDQNHRQSPRRRSPESNSECIVYHQVYGFGRNDFMKIGLVSPKISKKGQDEMESVLLPRRVGLRCKVKTVRGESLKPQGIFSIAASVEHSAALVRRASGDVELYAWGHGSYGALGLGLGMPIGALPGRSSSSNNASSAIKTVPVPSFVACLSRTSNPDARVASLLLQDEREYPMGIALGPRCSFVTTSMGRCFSFGMSDEGMLGLGKGVMEAHEPTEICFPRDLRSESIVSVSVGATHVVALTRSGKTLGWGNRVPAGLCRIQPQKRSEDSTSHSTSEPLDIAWSPEVIEIAQEKNDSSSDMAPLRIAHVCAGYDSSVFVCDSGRVLSCGRSSGRLGLGEETEDVLSPSPLFGGLRLWQQQKGVGPISMPAPLKLRRRGTTLG